MRVRSAGRGYQYLLKSVATGDGERDLGSPLTRYYAENGTPLGCKKSCVVSSVGALPSDIGDVTWGIRSASTFVPGETGRRYCVAESVDWSMT